MEENEVSRLINDEKVFAENINKLFPSLLKTARLMVRDEEEAREAVQEAAWNAWRKLYTFRGDAKFSTWVSKINRNVCRDSLWRQKRKQITISLEDLGDLPDARKNPEDKIQESENKQQLWQALRRLSPKRRAIIEAVYGHRLKHEDVAKMHGMTKDAVKTECYRTLTELRKILKHTRDPRVGIRETGLTTSF